MKGIVLVFVVCVACSPEFSDRSNPVDSGEVSSAPKADEPYATPCTTNADCDDGNFCTDPDMCEAGQCLNYKIVKRRQEAICDDGNFCTNDWCDHRKGGYCLHVPIGGCAQ